MLALLFQDPEIQAQAGEDFGGRTEIHPLGVAALALLSALAMLLPRRWSALPVILLLCFIPAGQRIVIATLDFPFIRLLMMVVWLRLLVRRELKPIVWNHLDRAIVAWSITSVITGWFLGWTLTIVVNRVGASLDAMMAYFFFRLMIRNHRDLALLATQFIMSGFAVLVFFVVENRTSRNMFAVFGGVPAITDIRDGRLRCQGAFAHSILAGCFWACLIPFYCIRGVLDRKWLLPLGGGAAAVGIVALCSSSTPIMALVFGVMAAGAFYVRGALRWIRWLIFLWLCVLHCFLMKTPVWHLLARVDIVGGSTGWHRYLLVDAFIERVWEWWPVGVLATGHWGPGLHDVTNQFVAEGAAGGMARLATFVATVVLAFMGVSRSLRLPVATKPYVLAAWALGVAMFMHCMNFLAVSYFEQIVVEWYLTLAAIGSLTLVPGAPPERQLAALAEQ